MAYVFDHKSCLDNQLAAYPQRRQCRECKRVLGYVEHYFQYLILQHTCCLFFLLRGCEDDQTVSSTAKIESI